MSDSRNQVTCLDKALQLLAQRSHFEAELERKLRRRSYPDSEIEQTLSILRRDRVLDDREVATEFATMRRERRGEGPARIRQELLRRGVSAEIAAEAVEVDEYEQELERARGLAERRAARGADEAAIARFLTRKGYGKRVILTLLEELRRDAS